MFLGLVYSSVPLLYSSSNKIFSKDKLCSSVKIFLLQNGRKTQKNTMNYQRKFLTKNMSVPESSNTNNLHQLFDYTITFEYSYHENTYSKSDFELKLRV